jgi:hypothetical protein
MTLTNKQISGLIAKQEGENAKNQLAINLSYNKFKQVPSTQLLQLLSFMKLDLNDIDYTTTISCQDKGTKSCSKPDIKITLNGTNQQKFKYPFARLSIKSTYQETQLAVHSLNSFEKHLNDKGVLLNSYVKEFLYHFCYADLLYKNKHYQYSQKPQCLFIENQRRDRFSVNEINNYNPILFEHFKDFIKMNAKTLLYFLISTGEFKDTKEHANILAFCNKNANNLLFIDVAYIIDKCIEEAKTNNTMVVLGRNKRISGITTISLFNGLVKLQMKGSGDKEFSSYHNLQFKISGTKIKKLLNME